MVAWWYSGMVIKRNATPGGDAPAAGRPPPFAFDDGDETMVQPLLDPLAYSVADFCAAVGISPRTFWALQKSGDGPPVTRIGRRVLVRRQAAELWLASREDRAAA